MWPESGRGLRACALEWAGSHGKWVGAQGVGGGAKGGKGWELSGGGCGLRGCGTQDVAVTSPLPLQLWEDEATLQRVMATMGIDRWVGPGCLGPLPLSPPLFLTPSDPVTSDPGWAPQRTSLRS